MFETELKFFIDNQGELYKKYPSKVLVLIGTEVVGVYDSPLQAYMETIKTKTPGTFMIQTCGADASAYTLTISSFQLAQI